MVAFFCHITNIGITTNTGASAILNSLDPDQTASLFVT